MIDPVVALMCVFAACMVLVLMLAYLSSHDERAGPIAMKLFKLCTCALVALAFIYKVL